MKKLIDSMRIENFFLTGQTYRIYIYMRMKKTTISKFVIRDVICVVSCVYVSKKKKEKDETWNAFKMMTKNKEKD